MKSSSVVLDRPASSIVQFIDKIADSIMACTIRYSAAHLFAQAWHTLLQYSSERDSDDPTWYRVMEANSSVPPVD